MNPTTFDRRVRRELDALLRDGVLTGEQHETLAGRYPLTRWDWHALGRWFLVFGAVSAAAGIAVLARELTEFTLEKLAFALAFGCAALLGGGHWIRDARPAFVWTPRALELLAGFAVIGLSFTLGVIFSDGSGNWPALLAIDLVVLLALSYALGNVLLLILSAVVFFCWFGGFTGYASGWGAYWFGMSYPLRFLGASGAIVAISLLHRFAEGTVLAPYRGFFKVWLSAGLFFAEMALWLMSLFGNFDLEGGWRMAGAAELVAFNVLWMGLNAGLIGLGARSGMRMLTGYGATFLIIQGYTLFFAHLADDLGLLVSLLVTGATALALAVSLERRRAARAGSDPATGVANTAR